MKILHLRASNFYGGPERQLHYHARLAGQTGLEITVASFSEAGQMPEFLKTIEADNIPVKLFNVKNAYDTKAVSLIRDHIIRNQIDILCTHDYRTHFYANLAVKKTACRWLAFSRGWTKENLKIRLFCFIDKFVIRKADHIVAVSEAQKQKLVHSGISSEQISTVHNAIDTDLLETTERLSLRKRFGLSQKHHLIVSGGRFSEEKGQIYLIKAAQKAVPENENLRFILFGDGPDLGKCLSYISQNKLENYIFCPGFEKNLLGYLKDADILVNPSLSEGLPNIVLEALAASVPVIATEVGGLAELIKDEYSGCLVPAEDENIIAEKILKLVSTEQLRKTFIENGRNNIKEHFNFESQNRKLISIYNRSLK